MTRFWESPGWEESDPHLHSLRKMPFRRSFPDVRLGAGVFVIRGPRQIGKTSFLKTLLSGATRAGKRCFYLSCEAISTHVELLEILKSLSGSEFLFLDEVSFVPEWSRAVKSLVDAGSTQGFFITGSNANDLRKGLDLMPGRWGGGGEIRILPMLFDEFSAMRASAGFRKLDRIEELELFFKIGGFPLAVAESGDDGRVPQKSMRSYLQWIQGDLVKLGKIEVYGRELMGQIARTLGSSMSLQTLASKTQMGSHHTAQEYVQILEACFALRTLYCIDPDEENFRFRKEKKFYFTDPLIYQIAMDWAGFKVPANFCEKIAEQVAHETLAREHRRFGYFSNKNGEVDFLKPKEWAIEVKWADAATNLSKTYLNLAVPEKKVWIKQNYLK